MRLDIPRRMLTFVVTNGPRQMYDYCRRENLNPEACRLVTTERQLLGIDLCANRAVFYGEYWLLPELDKIMDQVEWASRRQVA